MKKILVTGALGQIGAELTPKLVEKYGKENVVAVDIARPKADTQEYANFELADVLNREQLAWVIARYEVDTIYHLAAILSARGEKTPALAFQVNIIGLYNILELGREHNLDRIIFPSSIGVFGPETPKEMTPNETILRPKTMYGITKVTGELLGNYYFDRYGLDVRGLRLPGVISYKVPPGGGTTDYAVEMFYAAVKNKHYTCFVKKSTRLPMMYMPDCIKAIIQLAEAPLSNLKHHCDFNVSAMSFTAGELASAIKEFIPEFTCEYKPDERQSIADSWPSSIDDTSAREEWGWMPTYDLRSMTEDMIQKLSARI